jgi:uncharacterized protein (TIGR03435 family)
MLQNLLNERFHLQLHTISKEVPAYKLVIAKSGSKLDATHPAPSHRPGWPDLAPGRPGMVQANAMDGGYFVSRLRAPQQPISALIRYLRPSGELPVVDQTGLAGLYDFTLEYSQEPKNSVPPEPSNVPTLFDALTKQLGLQLIRAKLPFEFLVIDSFDRIPSGN